MPEGEKTDESGEVEGLTPEDRERKTNLFIEALSEETEIKDPDKLKKFLDKFPDHVISSLARGIEEEEGEE